MLFRCTIEGESPIIHNNGAGIDPNIPANSEKREITRKRGSNRTEADDARLRELEIATALWFNEQGNPTIPQAAIRAVIEAGARKLKQGPQVREGLVVDSTEFNFDRKRYGDNLEDWLHTTQFTVPVVVQKSRLLRTRAKFDCPWSCTFDLDCDEELVSKSQLEKWLDIAGRRVGLGDWRPACSGHYGRFSLTDIEEL